MPELLGGRYRFRSARSRPIRDIAGSKRHSTGDARFMIKQRQIRWRTHDKDTGPGGGVSRPAISDLRLFPAPEVAPRHRDRVGSAPRRKVSPARSNSSSWWRRQATPSPPCESRSSPARRARRKLEVSQGTSYASSGRTTACNFFTGCQPFHKEMRLPHPELQGSEGMLHRAAPYSHYIWLLVQPVLNSLKCRFVLPAFNAALLASSAFFFQLAS
jgi:hypothetical protein